MRWFLPLLGVLLGLGLTARAEACVLRELAAAEGAEHRIYFTRFEKEDTSDGRFRACRLTKKADGATATFFVTPFRQDATVVVHRANWPKK